MAGVDVGDKREQVPARERSSTFQCRVMLRPNLDIGMSSYTRPYFAGVKWKSCAPRGGSAR